MRARLTRRSAVGILGLSFLAGLLAASQTAAQYPTAPYPTSPSPGPSPSKGASVRMVGRASAITASIRGRSRLSAVTRSPGAGKATPVTTSPSAS